MSENGDSFIRGGSAGFLLIAPSSGAKGVTQNMVRDLGKAGFKTRALTPDAAIESNASSGARQAWDTAVDAALADLGQHCEHVVVAGLATSAGLALEVAARRPDIVRGVVSYEPVLQPASSGSWLERFGALAIRQLGQWPRVAQLSRAISQPALIVHGRDDQASVSRDVIYLQRNLRGRVDVVVLNGRDHLTKASRQRDVVLARTEAFARRVTTMIGASDRAAHAGARRSAAAI